MILPGLEDVPGGQKACEVFTVRSLEGATRLRVIVKANHSFVSFMMQSLEAAGMDVAIRLPAVESNSVGTLSSPESTIIEYTILFS